MNTIIVCEDIPNNVYRVERALQQSEYTLEVAKLPNEAIRIAFETSPAAILMDLYFDNYEDAPIPLSQRYGGSECGVYLHGMLNVPIIFFTVTPEAIQGDAEASVIAERYGILPKAEVERWLPMISEAIKKHQAWNSDNAFLCLDDELKISGANEAAISHLACPRTLIHSL